MRLIMASLLTIAFLPLVAQAAVVCQGVTTSGVPATFTFDPENNLISPSLALGGAAEISFKNSRNYWTGHVAGIIQAEKLFVRYERHFGIIGNVEMTGVVDSDFLTLVQAHFSSCSERPEVRPAVTRSVSPPTDLRCERIQGEPGAVNAMELYRDERFNVAEAYLKSENWELQAEGPYNNSHSDLYRYELHLSNAPTVPVKIDVQYGPDKVSAVLNFRGEPEAQFSCVALNSAKLQRERTK